jgi:hypothetical protein
MTNQKVMEMLMLRRACMKRALGMVQKFNLSEDGEYIIVNWESTGRRQCTGDCQNCGMAFNPQEMMELLDKLIMMMTEKTEEEDKTTEWHDWQAECEKEPPRQLAI